MVVVVVKLSGVFSLRSRDDYGLPKGGLGFFFPQSSCNLHLHVGGSEILLGAAKTLLMHFENL